MVETTRWSNFEYSSMYSTMGIIFHLGLGYNIPPTRQMMLTLSTGHPNDVLVPLRFLATCLCLYLFAPPTFTHTYTCHQPLKFQFSAFDMTGCQYVQEWAFLFAMVYPSSSSHLIHTSRLYQICNSFASTRLLWRPSPSTQPFFPDKRHPHHQPPQYQTHMQPKSPT
jgi:hypothetical protein